MHDEPFIPFYKPYGMDDQQYEQEILQAQERHAQWELEQEEEFQITNPSSQIEDNNK